MKKMVKFDIFTHFMLDAGPTIAIFIFCVT